MLQSINQGGWKPHDRTRHHSDVCQVLETGRVADWSFTKTLETAFHNDARTQQQLARSIGMTPGNFSKFLRALGEEWARRLVAYMRETNSIAPLQWLADRVGCDVVPREERT